MKKIILNTILHCFALLPLRMNHLLGAWIGYILYFIKSRPYQVSLLNIKLCFPETSPSEQQLLVKKSLLEMGKTLTEMGPLWLWDPQRTLKLLVKFSGLEYLDKARSAGKGIILLTPHLGCWEIAGLYLGNTLPVTILYSKPKIAAFDEIIQSARKRSGAKLVNADMKGVKAILKTLGEGHATGMLPDQNPDDLNSGVFAPFFGIPTLTMTFISKLASKTGAIILIGYAERLEKGRGYHLHIREAAPDISSEDTLVSATAMNKTIEEYIREIPEQYQWSYKRFKKRPAGAEKLY
jgi:KDO2-lipid IV(A) lauroyltransferase